MNKKLLRSPPSRGCWTACRLFEKIQVDFTELHRVGQWKYLLVIVDHQWVEAFPVPRATALSVAKILLEHIIPRFGLVQAIDSDQE